MTALVLVTTVALAAAVQGMSGFGFALVAAPVLVAVTDPLTTVSVLAALGIVLNLTTLAGGGDREVLGREAAVLLAWAAPGVLAGAWLITRVPDDAIRVGVGVLVLGALGLRHAGPKAAEVIGPAPVARAVAGAAAGTGRPPPA